MLDKVLVTVVCKERRFDMEIPANVPVERLSPTLTLALQSKGIAFHGTVGLFSSGQLLSSADTLFQCGIWDGSCLELRDGG